MSTKSQETKKSVSHQAHVLSPEAPRPTAAYAGQGAVSKLSFSTLQSTENRPPWPTVQQPVSIRTCAHVVGHCPPLFFAANMEGTKRSERCNPQPVRQESDSHAWCFEGPVLLPFGIPRQISACCTSTALRSQPAPSHVRLARMLHSVGLGCWETRKAATVHE